MAISARRKHLMNRFGAIIKNLETSEENFTLDKQLGRLADKVEARMKHTAETRSYRAARNKARADKEVVANATPKEDPVELLRETAHNSSVLADEASNAAADCNPNDVKRKRELEKIASEARDAAMKDAQAYSEAAEGAS